MPEQVGCLCGQMGHGAAHGTQSVCPVCLRRIPARRIRQGSDVVLAKKCPEHGSFETVVWRGDKPRFADWTNAKTPSYPANPATDLVDGCPFDCGLCPEHEQHTCAALLEVTSRCNLGCPVCFASSGADADPDPDMETIGAWYETARDQGGKCNIQLSGGEPTVRDDLPEIAAMGRDMGFEFIQLNTNGLRLANESGYAARLKQAGLSSVFLQFDGVRESTHLALRGRKLCEVKKGAVDACQQAGLGVVLVPTVVPGVNDDELGDIVDFALASGHLVRGVHFQPASHFGRYPELMGENGRVTLPEIMAGLEKQTKGAVKVENFAPPGCEHALCSFHGHFLRTAGGGLRPLGGRRSCCGPVGIASHPAAEGARKSIGFTARQWTAPPENPEVDRPDPMGLPSLDQAQAWGFSISGMAFQDAWTLDLARLRQCCIHVVSPQGRLVPFCAWNLTSANGRALYRGKM